jgi:Roadblock/LC7 domain
MPQLSTEADDFNWLVGNLAKRTPGVAHAMVVSADGLPVAVSERLDRPKADQLAAIASGLASLTQGGARCMEGGRAGQTDGGRDGPGPTGSHGDQRRFLPDRAGHRRLRRGRGRLRDDRARQPYW